MVTSIYDVFGGFESKVNKFPVKLYEALGCKTPCTATKVILALVGVVDSVKADVVPSPVNISTYPVNVPPPPPPVFAAAKAALA